MRSTTLLAGHARRLNQAAGAPPIPALYFFTDPVRTPDPLAAAAHLPRGTAVVFRHFGAAGRARLARRLSALCRVRGLVLLIAADPDLAASVGADGVHWPERFLSAPLAKSKHLLVTASSHCAGGVALAARAGANACVLGPVFPTRSAAGRRPLGLFRASQIARAAPLPVIGLGGINQNTAKRLAGRGFAGFAAIDGLMDDLESEG